MNTLNTPPAFIPHYLSCAIWLLLFIEVPNCVFAHTLADSTRYTPFNPTLTPRVQPAQITCPTDVTVTCTAFDPTLSLYGQPIFDSAIDSNWVVDYQVNYTLFDSICHRGLIMRLWTVTDTANNTAQCSQRVTVNHEQNYWIKFPPDLLTTSCVGGAYGAPEFYGEDCELISISSTDEFCTCAPMDACYRIDRTWRVINWCTYSPNIGCTLIPNPNPNATTNHPANLPGVTVSPIGTTVPGWAPTIVKVLPTDPTTTNYGTFWSASANCYTYKQIIKVYDTEGPLVTSGVIDTCDLTPNDTAFYNHTTYWDPIQGSADLCEAEVDLAVTATDACTNTGLFFRYLLFLDMDGDGTTETVINSMNLPPVGTLNYNNLNTPNYTGGTPVLFDQRNVPENQKWQFGLKVNGGIARIRWYNQQNQNIPPLLPHGTHKVRWFVEDGCGNETVYQYTFTIRDCQKPTVVCVNDLSLGSNSLQNGMIALWTGDVLQYTDDNCTPTNQLLLGIRRSGVPDGQGATTGFPKNADGTPQTVINFSCADLGLQMVELWSLDRSGNADFCESEVLVQDNLGFCGPNASFAGVLATEITEGIEDAIVELKGLSSGIPISSETFSNASGAYLFSNALPFNGSVSLTPNHDVNPLNGVNTLDLIRISRHILGIEPLASPYQLIAADADKSGSVTVFDVVEIRKLILGHYSAFPNNTAWRFIDRQQTFTDPQNPFIEPLRESLQMDTVLYSLTNGDFIGVKIGDVDNTATSNDLVASDDRTAGTLLFDIEDRKVKAGETFTVNFKAADKVKGYQFTMNTVNLEVMDIVGGEQMSAENFAVFTSTSLSEHGTASLSEHGTASLSKHSTTLGEHGTASLSEDGAITTSADGTNGEFAVTFRANADGQLSQMLSVSSRITKAVAFTGSGDGANKLDVAFRFNNGGISTIAGVGFELYQNAPNPFVNKTFVGFHLPEATSATLSVYDETGRVLYTTTGDFGKGYNAVALDRASTSLGTGSTGVLYYKLETATHSATKKMIQTSK